MGSPPGLQPCSVSGAKLRTGVIRSQTARLLDQLGIKQGSRCLDVGCGGGHVVAELARRVGPRGSVLGLDLDPTVLELAAQEVEGVGNVTLTSISESLVTEGMVSAQDARALHAEMT
jgi:tRNA A58 N-methylase Trm61